MKNQNDDAALAATPAPEAGAFPPVAGSASVIRKLAYPSGPVEMPVSLWQWNGVRLMTHEALSYSMHGEFRVSEETTGFGIPETFGRSYADANAAAVSVLEKYSHSLVAQIARLPRLNNKVSNSG